MFLQGHLQTVFDALYEVGAIDPVLKMDWNLIVQEMDKNPHRVKSVFAEINSCSVNKTQLISKFKKMDSDSINYIAMEVAREFCEFQDRKNLH